MKFKKFLMIFISFLYFDLVFNLFTYQEYTRDGIINIFLFNIINSLLVYIFINIFNRKINKILMYIVYGFMGVFYSLHYIFYKIFLTPFSISLFKQSDQVLNFGKNIVISILQNIHVIILFLIPLILVIIFRKKIDYTKIIFKKLLIYLWLFVISILIYTGNVFIQGKDNGSTYSLLYETNNISLNIQKLGIPFATYIDIYRILFGFEEKIVTTEVVEDNSDSLFDYDYNVIDIDISSGNNTTINNYILSDSGSQKNKYTGMFEGKNLIYIVAESFSEIAVSEELTPTLYKLIHEGFYFENFYTSNNLSTIGGEFQALTGLYADNGILSNWRSGSNYYPYGLGNIFNNLGYKTYAYHNNSAYFQDRNIYLKSQGFNNFKGCYNGMEKLINCNLWPQSDVEMMNATVSDYINSSEPFMAYYMTVSGHFYYEKSENAMALKNWSMVSDLNYSETVKGHLATQIELDKALETLMNKLEEAGKLDDTVIVLLADHYPYNLSISDINSLSTYTRDSLIEANSNNLIIYNSKMKEVTVSKTGMSIDVLPTVLNLFGVSYDSRLIMGKDILSSTEGIAIFKDKSWVTDKGTYYASSGKFVAKVDNVSSDYVSNINNIVNNRVAISKMIVNNNYYKSIFK